MPSDDTKRVRREVELSLMLWGVKPQLSNHEKFHRSAINSAVSYSGAAARNKKLGERSPVDVRIEELRINGSGGGSGGDFPKDPLAAVRFVLRGEMDEVAVDGNVRNFFLVTDTLSHPFEPNYVTADRKTGKEMVRRSPQFSKYSESELDPFRRFARLDLPWHEQRWVHFQDADAAGGHVMEALVACQLVHHEACKSCFARNGLRYNGGSDEASSWADVVCVRCHATYEIKSKADNQKLENCWKYGYPGGSFRTYAALEPNGKRFLVVVSRQPSIGRTEDKHYPVTLAEIDHVVPRLTDWSFVASTKEGSGVPLRTIIKPNLSTRKRWCDLPACYVDVAFEVKRAYDGKFGEGKWDEMGQLRRRGDTKGDSKQEDLSAVTGADAAETTPEDRIEELKQALAMTGRPWPTATTKLSSSDSLRPGVK